MNGGMVKNDRRPLYEQAQSAIVERIRGGVYQAGQQLPREDELAASLGVSRTTIRTALGNLETLGYIRRLHGHGTFVAQGHFKVEAQLDRLETFHPALAARLGRSSQIKGLDIREVPADAETAAAMGLQTGAGVIRVARTVEIDAVPVVFLEEFMPTDITSVASLQETFRDSLVGHLDGKGGRPRAEWSETDLTAVTADMTLAGLLNLPVGATLFRLDEGLYTAQARLLLWSRIHIAAEYFKFHVRRQIVYDGNAEEEKEECSTQNGGRHEAQAG